MSASVRMPAPVPQTAATPPVIILDERDLRKYVIRQLEGLAHVSHIEAHESAAGITDLNIWLDGRDVWVELKVMTDRKPPKMRATQRRWHRDRHSYGGMSWVVVYDLDERVLRVIPGHEAAGLAPRVASWRAVGAERNVEDIADIIRSMVKRIRNAK